MDFAISFFKISDWKENFEIYAIDSLHKISIKRVSSFSFVLFMLINIYIIAVVSNNVIQKFLSKWLFMIFREFDLKVINHYMHRIGNKSSSLHFFLCF